SSGETKGSIDLTAEVTAKYKLSLTPSEEERYSTSITAGKDNYFSVDVVNEGSATIDNITFSSDKPKGWTIEFSPDEIDSLDAGVSQTIDVNIKPPSETIAGDYQISLKADAKQALDEIDIRVTVKTPPVGLWVGVGIIVLVIAGLAFIFMRFSRR
ncbi:MAG: NEW3 domain-containing protein, partial [Dehalococcoidia bacterium]|nr:NEW3 domain-containing protein [Dehalococcoidia bacterium]